MQIQDLFDAAVVFVTNFSLLTNFGPGHYTVQRKETRWYLSFQIRNYIKRQMLFNLFDLDTNFTSSCSHGLIQESGDILSFESLSGTQYHDPIFN